MEHISIVKMRLEFPYIYIYAEFEDGEIYNEEIINDSPLNN